MRNLFLPFMHCNQLLYVRKIKLTAQEIYIKQLQKALNTQVNENGTMKGFIHYQPDRCRWMVVWWNKYTGKKVFITRFAGQFMPCTAFVIEKGIPQLDGKGRLIPDKTKCHGYAQAEKLLMLIRHRQDQADRGECKFQIQEFTNPSAIAVVASYKKWLNEVIIPGRKPATIKGYQSYLRTWIDPWFKSHPVALHELDLATLMSFLKHVRTTLQKKNKEGNVGKTASNILSALHSAIEYAHRNGELQRMPPFPKLEDYGIQKTEVEWLSKEDLEKVFDKIPEEHRPIFDWLKYHFRRPGEACALYKTDYDVFRQAFSVRRAISARQLVSSVKTNWKQPTTHYLPCKEVFIPTAEKLIKTNLDSPFMFVNPRARKDGGRYTLEALSNVWYQACDSAGIERIWPYKGLKHTACTLFMEDGGNEIELQKLTGHKNMKSLTKYTDITLDRIRRVQEDADRRAEEMDRKRKVTKERLQDGYKVVFMERKDV
jgi:integrase